MREIKFRFWDKIDKKFITWPENVYIAGDGKIYTYANIEANLEEKDLIPIQYTDLKDKNGKEIYEGDVVKCKLSSTQRYKGTIQFKTGHFFIHAFWYSFKPIGRWDLEKRKLCGKSSTNLNIDCEMQIIGNIYENPGLAK